MSSNGIVIGGDSADIPGGTYNATLVALDIKTSDAFGDFRTWDFDIGNGTIVGGASSMNTGRRSKGGRWIAALLGRQPERGESVDVIGLPCLVVVAEDDNGWPKVMDVLPPMAPTAAQEPAGPVQAAAAPVPAERVIAPLP